jgi:hypothetical protein
VNNLQTYLISKAIQSGILKTVTDYRCGKYLIVNINNRVLIGYTVGQTYNDKIFQVTIQ